MSSSSLEFILLSNFKSQFILSMFYSGFRVLKIFSCQWFSLEWPGQWYAISIAWFGHLQCQCPAMLSLEPKIQLKFLANTVLHLVALNSSIAILLNLI